MDYDALIGRKVTDSDGDILEVVFIDRAVGITLQEGSTKICINGPMSKHDTEPDYDNLFDLLVKQIDNWYIDLDDLHADLPHGYNANGYWNLQCAVGD